MAKHAHNAVRSKMRWAKRFDRKPLRKSERFTYEGVRVDGRKAVAFFDNVANGPLFKRAIICDNAQALALVSKLNKAEPFDHNRIIKRWLGSLEK